MQLALSSKTLSQAQLFDYGQNFIRPQLADRRLRIPSPYGGKIRQVQVDIDQDKLQAYGLSAEDVVDAIGRQNMVTPVGTEKIGEFEYIVDLTVRRSVSTNSTTCRSASSTARRFSPRRRLRAFRRPAADQHGAGRRRPTPS